MLHLILFLLIYIFPLMVFSQTMDPIINRPFPKIEVSAYSQIRYEMDKKAKSAIGKGTSFGSNRAYRDSLINHLDTIIQAREQSMKDLPIYKAVWGKDTLTYRYNPPIKRIYGYDFKKKKKHTRLEVESKYPPYTRFTAIIEGLTENEIQLLTDSMRRMKPPQNALYNGEQTCIFYALEALFHTHGIWTEPIITRNTTYCNEKELPAFFNHFLCKGNDYPCHYKKIKDVSFPNNSIIAIMNTYGDIIHAIYHQDGLFYSKNGRTSPMAFETLLPIFQIYSRIDYKGKKLSKTGKMLKGDTIRIYTLNKAIFPTFTN